MKYAFVLLMSLTTSFFYAQEKYATLELSELFNEKTNEQFIGKINKINTNDSYKFLSLSAFSQNPTINAHLYYRIFTEESWSDWTELKEDIESKNEKRKVYGLITILKKIQKIQFKSDSKLQDPLIFRLFISMDNGLEDLYLVNSIQGCSQPSFCDRSCWCPSGDCTPQASPTYIDVTHVIVHHSAVNYTSGTDYKQVVYSYWDYHVNTHGWNDIGYNWLVDPNGVLYEGRGDSVQGAHFSCMNGNTMGVCVIGNFETAVPTTQSLETLENLIAWEATDKGIDVMTSSYHPPSHLNLQHVSGHKDGNSAPVGCPSGTACPGTHLYNELPTIRNDIAGFSCYMSNAEKQINSTRVYPNPVKNLLKIETDTKYKIIQLKVYNNLGMKMQTIVRPTNSVDFSNYNKGIYYIQFIYKNMSFTTKVIKN